jgi:uncharacterized membrane protein YczE
VQGWGLVSSLGLGSLVAAAACGMAMLISLDIYLQWVQRSTNATRRPIA